MKSMIPRLFCETLECVLKLLFFQCAGRVHNNKVSPARLKN